MEQLHKSFINISKQKTIKDICLAFRDELRIILQCEKSYVILNDIELRMLLKKEGGLSSNFALPKGESLELVTDSSALAQDDVKRFDPMFRNLAQFRK